MTIPRAATLGKLARLGALLLPTALAGCLSDGLFSDRSRSRDRDRDRDPLTGLPARIPADQRSVTAGPAPSDRVTPATLAGGSSAGLSGLGIRDGNTSGPDNSAPPPSGAWSGAESKNTAPPGGAKLGTPRLGGPSDSYAQPAAGSNRSPAIRARSFEEAQQFLMAHGVKWQRLQTTGEGDWTFSCTIPNKANTGSMKTYEAHDRYGLVAMQKVMDEIVRDQGAR